jgi:hypothetical protein
MNGVFQSPKWNLDNMLVDAASFGIGHKAASLIRFPFSMTFNSIRFGEGLPRGAIGISFLLAFPFAALLYRGKKIWLLLAVAAAYLLFLFYTMQYARYYVAILPVISILGVAAVFRLAPPPTHGAIPVFLLTALLLQPLLTPVMFWNIPDRFPIALAFGLETREAFLARALPGYTAAAYVNGVSRPNEKILGVDTENLRFYLNSGLETIPVTLKGNRLRTVIEAQSGDELAAGLKQIGFSHLFVTREAIKEPPPWLPYLQPRFLEAHASLKFKDDYALVYELR